MALTERQKALYNHTCDLYSTERNTDTDGIGTPGNEEIVKRYSDVVCHYEYTPNVDDPAAIGRFKRMTILTTDVIHLPIVDDGEQTITVGNGWWARNTTLDADGSRSANYGQVHKVLGAPRAIPGSALRPANKQSVMAMEEEHPPTGVS